MVLLVDEDLVEVEVVLTLLVEEVFTEDELELFAVEVVDLDEVEEAGVEDPPQV